jgi:hypothetical protein
MVPQPESRFLEAETIFVEARFRGRVVASRLLDARTASRFMIGSARRADAPVDPAFLPPDAPANDNHALVAATSRGFVVNLSPAMRARVDETARGLRVPCGEVVFDITEAAPVAPVPRSSSSRAGRRELHYTLAVAAVLLIVLAILEAVPSDRRALSFDDYARDVRFDLARIVPAALAPQAGGAEAPTASAPKNPGTSGQASWSPRPTRPRRGSSPARSAAEARAAVLANPMLGVFASHASAALDDVLAPGEALGDGADDVLTSLVASSLDRAYAGSGLTGLGTGAGGGGTGEGMIGGNGGRLPTIGLGGGGSGKYGRGVGPLGALPIHVPKGPTIIPGVIGEHRGALDKEIIRRVVRTHLNEIRFCYSEALAKQPSLAGRVVVQFTIGGTGTVLASVLQTSTLASPSVEKCIVDATKRWAYPKPEGGGLVVASYPFQLVPAGG